MTRICYFVSSLELALSYGGKLLVEFTPFQTRAQAVAAMSKAQKLNETDVPVVGRIEVPDEYGQKVTQIDSGYFTQVGYDPSTPPEVAKQHRLSFRRHHLNRISVVPWDSMREDIGVKADLMLKARRACERAVDYHFTHAPKPSLWSPTSYVHIFSQEGNNDITANIEAYALAAGQRINEIDKAKREIGLSSTEEILFYLFRHIYLKLNIPRVGSHAALSAKKVDDARIPEWRAKCEEELQQHMLAYQVAVSQLDTTVPMLRLAGIAKSRSTEVKEVLEFMRKQNIFNAIDYTLCMAPVDRVPLPVIVNLGMEELDQMAEEGTAPDEVNRVLREQVRLDRPGEDPEMFLPRQMRTSGNLVSDPTESPLLSEADTQIAARLLALYGRLSQFEEQLGRNPNAPGAARATEATRAIRGLLNLMDELGNQPQ